MPDHASNVPVRLRTPTVSRIQEPNMRLVFEEPDEGTEIVRIFKSGSGSTPSTVEIRFEPIEQTERLTGAPSQLFNTPSVGQPLVGNIPVPQNPGDPDTTELVTVTQVTTGHTVRIPVRIKYEL